jgi:methylated-DNA-[protein]-cysteine S-methyltransferase
MTSSNTPPSSQPLSSSAPRADSSSAEQTISIWKTAWGVMGGVRGPAGVSAIVLPHYSPNDLRDLLKWEHPGARMDDAAFADLAELCGDYFNGKRVDFSAVVCDLAGQGPFARQILTACRQVPYGQTRTYTQLAAMAGQPDKARHAAQALGKNPVPLIIPCHRVLAAGGLGGFSAPGGVELKRRMLDLERQAADAAG